MKRIVCEFKKTRIVFGGKNDDFWLTEATGITEYDFSNVTLENGVNGGAAWYGAVMPKRNIVIKAALVCENAGIYAEKRELARKVFGIGQKITLAAFANSESRIAECYSETVEFTDDHVSKLKRFSVSLICPDPFFYGGAENEIVFFGTAFAFGFSFELKEKDTELGRLNKRQIYVINNLGESAETGITVVFKARGAVVNPEILHIGRNELIKINFAMKYGDEIHVTTGTGDKNVRLVNGGISTKINWAFDDESGNNGFIMLNRGENALRVDADGGLADLDVKVLYRNKYLGV